MKGASVVDCARLARAVVGVAAFGLLLGGCVADPLPMGGDGPFGGQGGADLAVPDGGEPDVGGEGGTGGQPDVEPEPEPDASGVDLGAGGVGGEPDAGFDEGVGGGEPVDAPAFTEVAVTRRGAETFFVWVDAAGQLVSLEVDDDARVAAGPTVLALPDVRPERVVAREVDGHPWVAFGGAGVPVVVFQVDLPVVTRVVLDQLFGPPLLARAGDGILVIARDADGDLAWQRITNELEVEPLVVDAFELGIPDDAAGVAAGVVLLFGGDGQCVQISDEDWQAAGTFVCPGGPSRILSDGQRAVVSHIYDFGADQNIGITGLYDDTDDYRVAFFELSSGTSFPSDGAERPVVGGRLIDGTRRLVASAMGPYETWDSVESWTDSSDWPFARVRAMARRTLAGRVQSGTCGDGSRCHVADDCDDDTCTGAVGPEHLLALDFRSDGRPHIRTYEVRRRSVGIPSYGIDEDLGCIPTPERCDGIDQDCDGRADDGRCCRDDARVEYRWNTPAPVATIADGDRLRVDMVVGDVELNNAYRMMYRYAGTQRWEGKTLSLRQAGNGEPDPMGITLNDAVDGRYLLAAGGITALVARQYVEGGEGDWALFIGHPSRPEGPTRPRAMVPLDCSEVLAADTLQHRGIGDGNDAGEQFLVICPDKMVRVHAPRDLGNDVYPFSQFDIPDIAWATIHRRGTAELAVLVGFQVPEEGLWAVRSLTIEGDQPGGPQPGLLPGELNRIGLTDAVWPIHRHPVAGRAPIQIRDGLYARLAFEESTLGDAPRTIWRDVLLSPTPESTRFSPSAFHLYSAGPVAPTAPFEEATGWWATDVTGNGGVYNLWSTEPVFTVPGSVAHWFASQGSYGNDDANVDIGRFDLAIVTPTDGGGRNWRFITRETRCAQP